MKKSNLVERINRKLERKIKKNNIMGDETTRIDIDLTDAEIEELETSPTWLYYEFEGNTLSILYCENGGK